MTTTTLTTTLTAAQAMEALRLFTLNFPHNFIKDVWGEGWLADHIATKLRPAKNESFISAGQVIKFISALDSGNSELLYAYIEKWYKNSYNR